MKIVEHENATGVYHFRAGWMHSIGVERKAEPGEQVWPQLWEEPERDS